MDRVSRSLLVVVLAACAVMAHGTARAGIFTVPHFDSGAPAIDPASLVPFERQGAATIKGHLGLTGPGYGQEIVLANEPVYAVPAIPYLQWYFMTYLTGAIKQGISAFPQRGDRRHVAEVDPVAFRSIRATRTDDQGRYRFDGLPSGRWYVVALPIVVYNGKEIDSGFFGDFAITPYTVRDIVLMGDEPAFDLIGSGPQTSHLVRIVPNQRAALECETYQLRGMDCQKEFDFDQFWGARSEY